MFEVKFVFRREIRRCDIREKDVFSSTLYMGDRKIICCDIFWQRKNNKFKMSSPLYKKEYRGLGDFFFAQSKMPKR